MLTATGGILGAVAALTAESAECAGQFVMCVVSVATRDFIFL